MNPDIAKGDTQVVVDRQVRWAQGLSLLEQLPPSVAVSELEAAKAEESVNDAVTGVETESPLSESDGHRHRVASLRT